MKSNQQSSSGTNNGQNIYNPRPGIRGVSSGTYSSSSLASSTIFSCIWTFFLSSSTLGCCFFVSLASLCNNITYIPHPNLIHKNFSQSSTTYTKVWDGLGACLTITPRSIDGRFEGRASSKFSSPCVCLSSSGIGWDSRSGMRYMSFRRRRSWLLTTPNLTGRF